VLLAAPPFLSLLVQLGRFGWRCGANCICPLACAPHATLPGRDDQGHVAPGAAALAGAAGLRDELRQGDGV